MKIERYVLITGASTGIGEACATHLDKLGFSVLAGVRKSADGERLKKSASSRLTPVMIDVTSKSSIDEALAQVKARVGEQGLYGLVNNAGIAVAGPLEVLTDAHLREQFDVNVFGLMAVTRASLPLLRLAKGRIVNMSSISGRTTAPLLGAYCASKYAVESLSDALRLELKEWGIRVAIIQPGMIATPIWDRSHESSMQRIGSDERIDTLYGKLTKSLFSTVKEAKLKAIAPQKVADAVGHALASPRPRLRYAVGTDAKVGMLLARYLPASAMDRLILSQLK